MLTTVMVNGGSVREPELCTDALNAVIDHYYYTRVCCITQYSIYMDM